MSKFLDKKIEEDIDFLKCHIFRIAQNRWNLSKDKCLDVFIKNKLFKYIEVNYEFMHMQGLETSVDDIERFLKCRKTNIVF